MKEHLDNDASDVGLGSVLSHREGERDVVIAYASRTMYKSERNYDVTKRELHAVVFGLHKYLCIRRFVGTWLNFIEEFQFDIEHRTGVRHGNADRLSRRPTAVSDNGELHVRATDCLRTTPGPVSAPHATTDSVEELSLSEMQLRDPEIGFVLRSLLGSAERPDRNSLAAASAFVKLLCSQWKLLQIVDGVLYRRFSYNDDRPDVLQLFLPFAMRKDFLEKVHAGMKVVIWAYAVYLTKSADEHFGLVGAVMFADIVNNARTVTDISGVSCHGLDLFSRCLLACRSSVYILTSQALIQNLDAALCIL